MGYDYTVTAGRLREGHEAQLCSALAKFAQELELECVAVNVLLCGEVYCNAYSNEAPSTPLQRTWRRCEQNLDSPFAGYVAEAENELIRGVLILHPYEPWVILWNHAAGGVYVGYDGRQLESADFRLLHTQSRKVSTEWVKTKLQAPPLTVSGWTEHCLGIHVPWTSSDAAQAAHCLRLLEQYGAEVHVSDHCGVWNQGINAWQSLAARYAAALDSEAMHPDANSLVNPDETAAD